MHGLESGALLLVGVLPLWRTWLHLLCHEHVILLLTLVITHRPESVQECRFSLVPRLMDILEGLYCLRQHVLSRAPTSSHMMMIPRLHLRPRLLLLHK